MNLAELRQTFCAKFATLTDELGIAAVNGDAATIAQLHQQAAGGDVALSDLWRANNFVRLHAAVAGGHVAVLQFLKEQKIIWDYDYNFMCIPGEVVGFMAPVAAIFGQIAVLEWMASSYCSSLEFDVKGLIRFTLQLKQFAVLQWALNRNLIDKMMWFMCEDPELLEWFARQLPLEKFVVHVNGPQSWYLTRGREVSWTPDKQKKLWIDVNWRESEMTVILSSKRRGLRLPLELWELAEEYFT